MAEITRRQTEALLEASRAQVDAAEAAKKAASHSGRITTYMLWSVIVLTITAVVNVITAIFR